MSDATTVEAHDFLFDADMRVSLRVTASGATPRDAYDLAVEQIAVALDAVSLGRVPTGGLGITLEISEASLSEDPYVASIDGVEISGDEDFCRTCGVVETGYGDGWDGECPDCADVTYAEEEGLDS